MIYAFMAAQSPEWWSKVPRWPSGLIKDIAAERLLADEARRHLGTICSLARDAGDPGLAQSLESGGHPGDEEFKYYAKHFGCAFLVIPRNQPQAVPWIYGDGPVGFVVEHSMTEKDEQGKQSGHFELLYTWIIKTKCVVDGLEEILEQILPTALLLGMLIERFPLPS